MEEAGNKDISTKGGFSATTPILLYRLLSRTRGFQGDTHQKSNLKSILALILFCSMKVARKNNECEPEIRKLKARRYFSSPFFYTIVRDLRSLGVECQMLLA
jgi:hypothetical protein